MEVNPLANRKILLIDDEQDIRMVVQLSLETVGGFDVLVAESGEAGLDMAAHEKPDAILLDVMMPGLDGPSTLERLKTLDGCAAIPVIFLTAKAQQAEVRRLKDLGPAGVLMKPFDPMTLSDQVNEILRETWDA